MKDSIFSDDQVRGVSQRHATRTSKASWDDQERASAIEDMDSILDELRRTNMKVESLEQSLLEREQMMPDFFPPRPPSS